MARGRPFGVWEYSFGPYSRWHQVVLEPVRLPARSATVPPLLILPVMHLVGAALVARGSVSPYLTIDAIMAMSGSMGARSGLYAPLRLYWEHEPPSECGNDWAPGVPCDAIWTPATGCDAAWTVQPRPPYACPEVMHG